jgi:cobalt-zinc-cadmium efflux system outer membrane protein
MCSSRGYEVKLAENERWPSITVVPYVQRQQNETRETQVGIGVSIPLPLWNRNKGAIDAAKAKEVQAEVMLTAQMRQLERDVAAQASHYNATASWSAPVLRRFRTSQASEKLQRAGALQNAHAPS